MHAPSAVRAEIAPCNERACVLTSRYSVTDATYLQVGKRDSFSRQIPPGVPGWVGFALLWRKQQSCDIQPYKVNIHFVEESFGCEGS